MTLDEQKRQIVELLIPLCPFVVIGTRTPGVVLPQYLYEGNVPDAPQPLLVLRIGRDPNVMGMPDLVLDAFGWRATISASGWHSLVTVPWAAVYTVWVDSPFEGPHIAWTVPELAEAAEAKVRSLRIVH